MHQSAPLPALLAGLLILTLAACSSGETDSRPSTVIFGRISVDASIDSLQNHEGFELRIVEPAVDGEPDTLFYAVTGPTGEFEGVARFPERDLYRMEISRYGNVLGGAAMILAEGDTIRFELRFPDAAESLVIESHENEIYRSYERLQSGINRVFRFAQAGLVTPDTLEMEILKWSDLFWDFYERNPGSYGGREAAASSVRLLEGLDSERMMERLIGALAGDASLVPFASRIGTRYYSDRYNLDSALVWLDNLERHARDERTRMGLKMNRINLLYDSARVRSARVELDEFKRRFSSLDEAAEWAERFEYDLVSLAPGSDMPSFEIADLDGDPVSGQSMKGSPYIIEFTRLDNLLYQQQFDRNVAIYQIYKNYGLQFITVPFAASEVRLNAFLDERAELWTYARPGSFDPEELQKRFNINIIPTRILVDRNGRIVRKYEGTEFDDIIRGLQVVINTQQQEEAS